MYHAYAPCSYSLVSPVTCHIYWHHCLVSVHVYMVDGDKLLPDNSDRIYILDEPNLSFFRGLLRCPDLIIVTNHKHIAVSGAAKHFLDHHSASLEYFSFFELERVSKPTRGGPEGEGAIGSINYFYVRHSGFSI